VTNYTFNNVVANHTIAASFSQIINPNSPPTAVRLLLPADGDTIVLDNLNPSTLAYFVWTKSQDPDSTDTLMYSLHVTGPDVDTTISGITDTSVSVYMVDGFQSGSTYTWTVSVTDGEVTVASPDTFSFHFIKISDDVVEETIVPKEYFLHQNYPNPFNPVTTIEFELPYSSVVTLKMYNLLGAEVATLIDGRSMNRGVWKIQFDASTLNSGVYFYRLVATKPNGTTFNSIRKMALVK